MAAADATRIEDIHPSSVREALDGGGHSESRPIVDLEGASVRLGSWIAEPGQYSSPGVPLGEWFVVVEGVGELLLEGEEPIALTPGTVVRTDARTPSQLRVDEKLSKISLIGL